LRTGNFFDFRVNLNEYNRARGADVSSHLIRRAASRARSYKQKSR